MVRRPTLRHRARSRLAQATADLICRTPAFLPGHYEHGFDSEVCAPGSSSSLYLKGGNDSNFGMTLKLPIQSQPGVVDMDGAVAAAETDADEAAFDGSFKPQSVSFLCARCPASDRARVPRLAPLCAV